MIVIITYCNILYNIITIIITILVDIVQQQSNPTQQVDITSDPMGNGIIDISREKAVSIAAICHLLLAILGGYSLMYPTTLIIADNATQTVSNIKNAMFLFRLSAYFGIFGQIAFGFLAISFHSIFRSVDRNYSTILLTLVLLSVPIAILVTTFQLGVVYLITDGSSLLNLNQTEIETMVMLLIELNNLSNMVAQVFWSLWLLPLGVLVYRSGYFPKVFGILLAIAGSCYLIDTSLYLLAIEIAEIIKSLLMILETIGEMSFMLWLLIKGADFHNLTKKDQYRPKIANY